MILSGLVCSMLMVLGLGITQICAENGLHESELLTQLKVPQCRERCMEQSNIGSLDCLQRPECLVCWNSCIASESSSPPPLESRTAELDVIELQIHSIIRQGSLTSADITWKSSDVPTQCLVTWEVFGGGLMGNLLTETPDAQLSLWPDTKYRVQVTCKDKVAGTMSKSLPITIDTSNATSLQPITTTTMTAVVPEINDFSSSASQATLLDQSTSSMQEATSAPASTLIETTTTPSMFKSDSKNIKVIVPRYQNSAPTKNSKSQSSFISVALSSVMMVVFLSFLVFCSVVLMKQQRKSTECDKKMLIGSSSEAVDGGECELNLAKKNIYLV